MSFSLFQITVMAHYWNRRLKSLKLSRNQARSSPQKSLLPQDLKPRSPLLLISRVLLVSVHYAAITISLDVSVEDTSR